MAETQFSSVSIPVDLAERIKKRIKGTGFTSLASYVTFVLREILGQSGPSATGNESTAEAISSTEKDELLRRLKNLGYIAPQP
jgi:Arc/MetJ-type ribon-helix-helix transcriptional regulator